MTRTALAAIAEAQTALDASTLNNADYWIAERMIDEARQCETDRGAAFWLASLRQMVPGATGAALVEITHGWHIAQAA